MPQIQPWNRLVQAGFSRDQAEAILDALTLNPWGAEPDDGDTVQYDSETGRTIFGGTEASTPYCIATGALAVLVLGDANYSDTWTINQEFGGFVADTALDDDHGLDGEDRELVFLPGPGIYSVTAALNIASNASSNLDLAELRIFGSTPMTNTYIPHIANASVYLEMTRIFRHTGLNPRPLELSFYAFTTDGSPANNGGTPSVASLDLIITRLGSI